jgi:hypothetical protein
MADLRELVDLMSEGGPAQSIQAAQQGFDQGQAQTLEARKAAFQQKLAEAGIISGKEANAVAGSPVFEEQRPLQASILGALSNLQNKSQPKSSEPKPMSEKDKAMLDLQKQKLDIQRQALSLKQKAAGPSSAATSPGQKALDTAFGKKAAEEALTGNSANDRQSQQILEGVAKDLESGKVVTGGLAGTLLPQKVQKVAAKGLTDARERVQRVIFPQLRQTMGAQFTEGEGNRVLDTTFNSAQPPEVNAQRIRRLQQVIQEQNAVKQAARLYFDTHGGSLAGFPQINQLNTSADDIINKVNGEGPQAPAGGDATDFIKQMEAKGFKFKGVK